MTNRRVLIQGAHACFTKCYICFTICKALQNLIFGVFSTNSSYKKKKKIQGQIAKKVFLYQLYLLN